MDLQLKLHMQMGIVHYSENVLLLRYKPEHTCASSIYYQVGLLTKNLQCEIKYIMNLNLDPTLLDTGDLILLSNLPKLWALLCAPEKRPLPLEYSTYRVFNRKYFVNFHSQQDYITWHKLFTCEENTATADGLLSMHYVF